MIYFPSPTEYHPDHRTVAALVWRGPQEAKHSNEVIAYEFSHQSHANLLVGVSGFYAEKERLIAEYVSPLDQNECTSIVKGINKARTHPLPKGVTFAEAFYLFDRCWGHLERYFQTVLHKSFGDILPYERPKRSIFIGTKNRPHLLERALDSLTAQGYNQYFEVVVVNDGGESVNDITDPFLFIFAELKLINIPTSLGRSGSANVGLINTTGQFINFLDDDDEFKSNHIRVFLSHWRQNTSIDVLYRGVEILNDNGEVIQEYNEPYCAGKLMQSNYIPIHSVTFSKKFIDMGCRFDESLEYMEDWNFWIQISRLTKFYHVPKVTAKYHMVGNSAASPHMYGTLDYVCHMNRVREKWMNKWTSVERSRMLEEYLQAERNHLASRKYSMEKKLIKRSISKSTDLTKVFSELVSEVRKGDDIKVLLPVSDSNIVNPVLLEIKEISRNYGFYEKYSENNTLTYVFQGRSLPESMRLDFARDYFESSRQLFESVFGETMPSKLWKWKYHFYEKNASPVITCNRKVVAHYGLIPRKICFSGSELPAYQACDVMVSSQHRGGLVASLYKNIIDFGLMQFTSNTVSTNSPALFLGFHMVEH